MEISAAQQILGLLADGIDPETGEMLPQDSVCNQPEVIRALHVALECLSMQKRKKTNKKWSNQGKSWTTDEEEKLVQMLERGESNLKIQTELQRSESAIASHLVRLGLISERIEYRRRSENEKHSQNNFHY